MTPNDSEVAAALQRILGTPAFARSPRLAQFLRFIVELRLSGRHEGPKEMELGIQVFGRGSDFDPRVDPVVRVQARQLRFKLHEYYETLGKSDSLRIELPKGSYLPSFSSLHDSSTPDTSIANKPAIPNHLTLNFRRWFAAVLLVGALVTVTLSWSSWRAAIGRVWAKTLPVQPKSAQSSAAELYLSGRFYWNKRTPEDLEKAIDYFTQSIVADPGYARAFVGLADSYGLMREFGAMPDAEAWPRALAASRKAVELDGTLAEAHSSLAFDLFYGSLDLRQGEREFKRAVELNPDYAEAHQWYGTALMSVGRLTEAYDQLARARELQPASRSILADQGLLLFYQGKHEQAINQLRQIENAEPSFRSAHSYLSYIYLVDRDGSNYLPEARQAAESSHDPVELAIVSEAELGFTNGGSPGMLDNLLRIQKKFATRGRYSAFRVAETCALLGRKREALEYLDTAYKNRESYMVVLAIAPTLWSLHSEPRYRNLLVQLGLDVSS